MTIVHRTRLRCISSHQMQVSWLTVQLLPLPASLRPEAVGIFVINIVLGVVCIFLK